MKRINLKISEYKSKLKRQSERHRILKNIHGLMKASNIMGV